MRRFDTPRESLCVRGALERLSSRQAARFAGAVSFVPRAAVAFVMPSHSPRRAVLAVALGLPLLLASTANAKPDSDPVLKALEEESARATDALQAQPGAPLYYLSYRLRDGIAWDISASFGALDTGNGSDEPLSHRSRALDVSARVGSPKLDNTHRLRGPAASSAYTERGTSLPIEDDLGALQLGIWRATDRAYRNAARQLIRVESNKSVKADEEDDAGDFSSVPSHVHFDPPAISDFDHAAWRKRIKALSAIFKDHPQILYSGVALSGGSWNIYYVDNAGTRVRERVALTRLMVSGTVKADDGMDLSLTRDFTASSPDKLPSDAEITVQIDRMISQLEAMRTAPVIEPYSGPAIITNRAAGVFFHEIFGHRVEGQRQKDADEGHTFTHKVGQSVVPAFISVVDDPTRANFGAVILNGHYQFDDEGVAAESVPLVENGVLKGFLMSRSPIQGFSRSNGHGRAQAGLPAVARQGNLIVSSAHQVPFADLRQQLIEEVKKQGKPWGLIFEDISGGFTTTRTGAIPQAFKVLPLVVKRVYPDGRPDELVRGVDIVGTPLQSFEKIIATGDDAAVFNGVCGAESGWVPVAAISPSLLVGEIEVERRAPSHDRTPILPPPLHPDIAWGAPAPIATPSPADAGTGSPR